MNMLTRNLEIALLVAKEIMHHNSKMLFSLWVWRYRVITFHRTQLSVTTFAEKLSIIFLCESCKITPHFSKTSIGQLKEQKLVSRSSLIGLG